MKPYFAFQWHITDNCDQRCKHCYIFSENSAIPIVEMSFANMQRVVGNCGEMCGQLDRIPYFYITGGDPLLHKDFWRLLELLKSKAISFSLMGNPFHLTGEVCRKLYACGCERYQISLDGLKSTHDHIRKRGSFDTTLEKIPCIRSAGMRSVIMTTVSGMNIDEIPRLIDVVVKHEVDVFGLPVTAPLGGLSKK
jgi:MoaA/NifB/PqqE/SkfB family radical SAM enzyme